MRTVKVMIQKVDDRRVSDCSYWELRLEKIFLRRVTYMFGKPRLERF